MRIEELLIIFLIGIPLWMLWPLAIGAGWTPTPKKAVNEMLELAEVGPGDTLYDLGSGDGRIIFMAAEEFGAKAIGIEADPLRVLWTLIWIWLKGLQDQVRVQFGNFYWIDLSTASVVSVFQSTRVNSKLIDKLLRELESGTRVISYLHTFDGWKPMKVDESSKLFLYEI